VKRGTISFGMRPTTEPAHHGGPVRCQGQPNQGNGPSAVNLRPPAPLVHGVLTAERDYAALYRAVGPALWQAIYAYSGGQRDLADDAVAEAFARAIQYDRGIRRPSSWLYRTAFRIAAAEIRRRRLQTEIVGGAAVDSPPEVEEVLTALRQLSPSQRAAVYLYYRADLPVREVASVMGTSVAAVKVHLHRGRKRLRELLGTEETEDV